MSRQGESTTPLLTIPAGTSIADFLAGNDCNDPKSKLGRLAEILPATTDVIAIERVRDYLEAVKNPNHQLEDRENATLLHLLIAHEKDRAAQALLQHPAVEMLNPLLVDNKGSTPLDLLTRRRSLHWGLVELMIQKGFDFFHFAEGHMPFVSLLERIDDPDWLDQVKELFELAVTMTEYDITPALQAALYVAIANGRDKFVELLTSKYGVKQTIWGYGDESLHISPFGHALDAYIHTDREKNDDKKSRIENIILYLLNIKPAPPVTVDYDGNMTVADMVNFQGTNALVKLLKNKWPGVKELLIRRVMLVYQDLSQSKISDAKAAIDGIIADYSLPGEISDANLTAMLVLLEYCLDFQLDSHAVALIELFAIHDKLNFPHRAMEIVFDKYFKLQDTNTAEDCARAEALDRVLMDCFKLEALKQVSFIQQALLFEFGSDAAVITYIEHCYVSSQITPDEGFCLPVVLLARRKDFEAVLRVMLKKSQSVPCWLSSGSNTVVHRAALERNKVALQILDECSHEEFNKALAMKNDDGETPVTDFIKVAQVSVRPKKLKGKKVDEVCETFKVLFDISSSLNVELDKNPIVDSLGIYFDSLKAKPSRLTLLSHMVREDSAVTRLLLKKVLSPRKADVAELEVLLKNNVMLSLEDRELFPKLLKLILHIRKKDGAVKVAADAWLGYIKACASVIAFDFAQTGELIDIAETSNDTLFLKMFFPDMIRKKPAHSHAAKVLPNDVKVADEAMSSEDRDSSDGAPEGEGPAIDSAALLNWVKATSQKKPVLAPQKTANSHESGRKRKKETPSEPHTAPEVTPMKTDPSHSDTMNMTSEPFPDASTLSHHVARPLQGDFEGMRADTSWPKLALGDVVIEEGDDEDTLSDQSGSSDAACALPKPKNKSKRRAPIHFQKISDGLRIAEYLIPKPAELDCVKHIEFLGDSALDQKYAAEITPSTAHAGAATGENHIATEVAGTTPVNVEVIQKFFGDHGIFSYNPADYVDGLPGEALVTTTNTFFNNRYGDNANYFSSGLFYVMSHPIQGKLYVRVTDTLGFELCSESGRPVTSGISHVPNERLHDLSVLFIVRVDGAALALPSDPGSWCQPVPAVLASNRAALFAASQPVASVCSVIASQKRM